MPQVLDALPACSGHLRAGCCWLTTGSSHRGPDMWGGHLWAGGSGLSWHVFHSHSCSGMGQGGVGEVSGSLDPTHWHSGIILLFMVQEPPLLQCPKQLRQLGATRPSVQLQRRETPGEVGGGECQGWAGPQPVHLLAGDIPALFVDGTGAVQAAAALVHLASRALKVGSAAALAGAIGSHLARAQVLTVVRALPCTGRGGASDPPGEGTLATGGPTKGTSQLLWATPTSPPS